MPATYAGTVPLEVFPVTYCEIAPYEERTPFAPASAWMHLQSLGCAG